VSEDLRNYTAGNKPQQHDVILNFVKYSPYGNTLQINMSPRHRHLQCTNWWEIRSKLTALITFHLGFTQSSINIAALDNLKCVRTNSRFGFAV